MILVLIMVLLQLIKHTKHTQVFNEKEWHTIKCLDLLKKVLILVLISTANSLKCISLKNQECRIRKTIINNDYIAFPYKIGAKKCIGSCDDINNPNSKVCIPDIVKNVSIKVFDLVYNKNKTKLIKFHESCKCNCLINSNVCNNKLKWSNEKCRCECLKIENCENSYFWDFINCKCGNGKISELNVEDECDYVTTIDDSVLTTGNNVLIIKTITKQIENCKPFVASSILFASVSVIVTGIVVYFCFNSRNNNILPY